LSIDDVALLQRGHEHRLRIGEEGWAVQCVIDHVRCGHTVDAQGGNKRQGFPMPVRYPRDQSLADGSAAIEPGHLCRHGGLIDEDETRSLQHRLRGLQLLACGSDIRSSLLGRVQEASMRDWPVATIAFY
jgi:hypothetical protein